MNEEKLNIYNNPGNLEKGQGYAGETGETYADDRERPFVVFDSPQMGVRALAMDLQTKIERHDGNVDKIVAQYAPNNENDTIKYQEFVKEKLKKDKVTKKDLKYLVQAVIEKENTPEVVDYYFDNPDVVKEGVAMSFFQLPKGVSLQEAREKIIEQLPKKKPQMNEGGSVKKQMAEVLNKDAPEGERLAYINSQEEKMLKDAGGSGELTEAGIPSYRGHTDSHGGGGGSGSGGNTGSRGPGGGGQRGRERQKREQERQRKEKEAKAKADREAADRRERARIATEEENRRVSEIKERERKRKADEEAANRREQARIATEEENKRLREIKAKEEAKKERRDERAAGSTVSQVEQTFGPLYSGSQFGYGLIKDPTSSTYNPKFTEFYGAGYDTLNYSKTQEILGGDYSEDTFSGEVKEKGIIDSIVDTATDLTTFGSENQFQVKPKKDGLEFKYNFKRGGLLDRSSKK
jgi:hypothetical protein